MTGQRSGWKNKLTDEARNAECTSAAAWAVLLRANRSQYRRQYREFVRKLRAARKSAGMTQVEAANQMGVPQSFISKCESGERRVDVVELQLFAPIYEKPLTFFLQ